MQLFIQLHVDRAEQIFVYQQFYVSNANFNKMWTNNLYNHYP